MTDEIDFGYFCLGMTAMGVIILICLSVWEPPDHEAKAEFVCRTHDMELLEYKDAEESTGFKEVKCFKPGKIEYFNEENFNDD